MLSTILLGAFLDKHNIFYKWFFLDTLTIIINFTETLLEVVYIYILCVNGIITGDTLGEHDTILNDFF